MIMIDKLKKEKKKNEKKKKKLKDYCKEITHDINPITIE